MIKEGLNQSVWDAPRILVLLDIVDAVWMQTRSDRQNTKRWGGGQVGFLYATRTLTSSSSRSSINFMNKVNEERHDALCVSRAESTGALWYVIGTDGDVDGARSSTSMKTARQVV